MRRRGSNGHRLTEADRFEIQRRVSAGESFIAAAQAVGCSKKSIQRFLARTGGVAPKAWHRSARHLSLAEREEILRGVLAGLSLRDIAARLGRAPSTISREVRRNARCGDYQLAWAESAAAGRARRPKPCKLVVNDRLRAEVEKKLSLRWSPQQISARLVHEFPDDPEMRVSHETIYRSLYVQARGALRKELAQYLRTRRTQRRSHKRTECIGTGRIRVMLVHLPNGRDAEAVRLALSEQVQRLPAELRQTLTWDQGKEMAEHVKFTLATNMRVYFCDPHSPWQRGSNENTNGLLRQYFPKSLDLSTVTLAQLEEVARELNDRPRQTLDWMKPCEVFSRTVASTG